jgi:hypothetical protein
MEHEGDDYAEKQQKEWRLKEQTAAHILEHSPPDDLLDKEGFISPSHVSQSFH